MSEQLLYGGESTVHEALCVARDLHHILNDAISAGHDAPKQIANDVSNIHNTPVTLEPVLTRLYYVPEMLYL